MTSVAIAARRRIQDDGVDPMDRQKRKFILAAGIVLTLSACASSSGTSLGAYSVSPGQPVKVGCGGAYMVAAKPEDTRVLVTPYAASGLYQAACEAGRPGYQSVTGVAYEEGAREYLVSVLKRPECQIIGGARMTPLHSEFSYSCPTL